jgi:hypothetical protein
MGEALRVARGTKLDVGAAAQLNPDVDSLDRLELNANIISTSFLIRNSARDGRQVQWGLRYVF